MRRNLLLSWDVSADQEEPWRRFLQELSGPRYEGYAESRRGLGISAESVWLAPKPSGGGVAVVFLETEYLERALCDLVASETLFDSWYGTQVRSLFGRNFPRPPRVAGGEPLFAWREAAEEGRRAPPGDS
jgi:hypothetical protein